MLGLIVRALASRRAPTVTLVLLAVLSAGAAAAAPQYVATTARDLAMAAAEAAPVLDRSVAVQLRLDEETLTADRVSAVARDVAGAFDLPGLTLVPGLRVVGGSARPGPNGPVTNSPLVHREGVCDQLVLDGACPRRAGEVAVGAATAAALGVAVGDRLSYAVESDRPIGLQVVAVYRPVDPYADYWAGRALVAPAGQPGSSTAPDSAALFTVPATIVDAPDTDALATVDALAGGAVFARTPPLEVRDRIALGQRQLGDRGYEVQPRLRVFAVRTYNSQLDVVRAVPISLVELLVLCWVALYLAVRHGAQERHRDIGLLKLRGAGRPRMLVLALGQSALPLLAGGALGLLAASPLRPGSAVDAGTARIADLASLAAAGVAVLGALLAAAFAERRALSTPVALLMRAVPPRRTGWRYGTTDAVIVVLALAGAYETQAYARAEAGASWLALLTPALLALAVGVLLARVLVPVAARVAARALRAGRLGTALTATELARRPAVPRLVAVLTAAVALFGTAVAAADTSGRAGRERAAAEIGADRVLVVEAGSRRQLLEAVRAVDPDGGAAMAVVSSNTGVLAVDATRLAAVARWRGEYGGRDAAAVAARLRAGAAVAAPPAFTGTELTLDATGGAVPAAVTATLAGATGTPVAVMFGPLGAGRATYRGDAPGCAPGCRLVSLSVEAGRPVTVRLHALRGRGGGLDAAALGDRTRWRTAVGPGQPPPGLGGGSDGMVVVAGQPNGDPAVYVDDAPDRLPVVAAGQQGPALSAADPHLQPFPGTLVPVDLAGGAGALPRVGRDGTLVDLDTADRMQPDFGRGESMQVWLTADAPADLPARLADLGVRTITTGTIADLAERYGRQAAPASVRFQLVTAAIMVLLAAGALGVVVAVESGPRAAELRALRRQGVAARTARWTALGGYAAVVALAVVAGLASAVVARTALGVAGPPFADGWAVLPPPPTVRALPLLAAGGAAAAVLVLVAAAAAGRLPGVRRVAADRGEVGR
jgi:FtsX-like permease family protein